MRHFLLLKAVCVAAVLMALAPASASAQLPVPWKFTYSGIATITPELTFSAEGAGFSFYLGEVDVAAASLPGTQLEVDPTTGIGYVAGAFEMAAADGGDDTVVGLMDEYILFATDDGTGNVLSIIFHTVTDGSGRFRNAAGFGVATGETNLVTGEFDYQGAGLITAPRRP